MEETARQLRESVKRLGNDLYQAKKQLEAYEKSCRHECGETIYDPIYTKAYTIPGDPPGTMGVDWQGPLSLFRQKQNQDGKESARNAGLNKSQLEVKRT